MPVKRSARPAPHPVQRTAQRRRTRKAIVDAAMALIIQGKTPSVNDVAAAADVSRRTVYLYFPTFDQLLIDATVGALSETQVTRAIEDEAETDVLRRLDRLVHELGSVTPQVERLGRTLIRLTVASGAPKVGSGRLPRRGYRRLEWIESAIAPLERELGASGFRRLVCALAMVVGWEALIVQRDVCGLTATEGETLSLWAARALVGAAREGTRQPAAGDPVTTVSGTATPGRTRPVRRR